MQSNLTQPLSQRLIQKKDLDPETVGVVAFVLCVHVCIVFMHVQMHELYGQKPKKSQKQSAYSNDYV